jgi:broad specificity phosphatase PhoE
MHTSGKSENAFLVYPSGKGTSKDEPPPVVSFSSGFFPLQLDAMRHLYLVRHGTTAMMEAEKVQGATDNPLSPSGIKEAQAAAQALHGIHFDAVFCSPLKRAHETAIIICSANNSVPIVLDNLREMDFGWLEGRPYFETPDENSNFCDRLSFLMTILIAQASGEWLAHVRKRALESWREIRQRCPQGRILLVAHSVVINYIIHDLLSGEENDRITPLRLKPCSITELEIDDADRVKTIRMNDAAHLEKAS